MKRYLKECRRLFPVYGKRERQFLKKLNDHIEDYEIDYPDLTYEDMIKKFGSPKEIIISYYDSVDDDYLLRKTNLSQRIRFFLISILLIVFIFYSYRTYTVYQSFKNIQDSIILHEETTIEELP